MLKANRARLYRGDVPQAWECAHASRAIRPSGGGWGAPSKTVPITAERIEPLKVPARNCVKHYNATVSLGLGARTS